MFVTFQINSFGLQWKTKGKIANLSRFGEQKIVRKNKVVYYRCICFMAKQNK
jgi:hypothetical protein